MTLKTAHDITKDFESLEQDGKERLALDLLSPDCLVSIGARYLLATSEVLVVYITRHQNAQLDTSHLH